MVQSLEVIDGTWPLLVLRFPRVVDADVVQAMIDAFARAHRRRQPFVSILDATCIAKLPREPERHQLVEWLRSERIEQAERQYSLAAAIVLPSAALRAFVSAIYVIRRPATPHQWVPTLNEAIDWSCGQLVAAGVALTPEIERLRAAVAREASAQ